MLLLLLLIPIWYHLWSLHSLPSALFGEVPCEPREGPWIFPDTPSCRKVLGTWDVPGHLCYSLGFAQAEQDMENRGQVAGWHEPGDGVWTAGGEQGTSEQFLFPSPERTQWRLIHEMRALIIKARCDHFRLQHHGVPSLFARPSDVGPDAQLMMAEGDPNQVTILTVKGKAILVLWSAWSISRAGWWSSWERSSRAEPAQPGMHPRVPHARMV